MLLLLLLINLYITVYIELSRYSLLQTCTKLNCGHFVIKTGVMFPATCIVLVQVVEVVLVLVLVWKFLLLIREHLFQKSKVSCN